MFGVLHELVFRLGAYLKIENRHNTTQADPAWARSVLVPGGTWCKPGKEQPRKNRVWLSLVAGPARR